MSIAIQYVNCIATHILSLSVCLCAKILLGICKHLLIFIFTMPYNFSHYTIHYTVAIGIEVYATIEIILN